MSRNVKCGDCWFFQHVPGAGWLCTKYDYPRGQRSESCSNYIKERGERI